MSTSLRNVIPSCYLFDTDPLSNQQVTWTVQAYHMSGNSLVNNKLISLKIDEILNSTATANSNGYTTFSVPFQFAGGHNITFYSPTTLSTMQYQAMIPWRSTWSQV